ncbi:hypothetical protein B0H15DRAFT_990853 [Mycena belliarum]|uniref:ZZ-type domain-containing protein n=1 Tax=Mycena belliarum TaxID=1033014 RepID=A0AAD6XT13_9AGAR|nr:hypothetical protein B0H15DRAFT_990853 [Mycena belliae]
MGLTYYSCDNCARPIPATDPRIHCLDCVDYDLCANCAVGERFGGTTHIAGHSARVYKISGGGAHAPAMSAAAIVYAGTHAATAATALQESSPAPNRPSTPVSCTTSVPATNTLPPPPPFAPHAQAPTPQLENLQISSPTPTPILTSAQAIHLSRVQIPPIQHITSSSPPAPPIASPTPPPKHPSMGPPLPARPRPSSIVARPTPHKRPTSTSVSSLSNVGVSSHTMSPRDESYTPPSPPPPRIATPSEAHPSGWGPFFLPDMGPTPVFTHLLRVLFAHLDSGRTGFLVPEVYSGFLIDQGYVGQDNTWNANLIAGFNQTKEEAADAALRRVFDLFSIQYELRTRLRPPSAPVDPLTRTLQAFSATLGTSLAPAAPTGAHMPVLTFPGFLELTSIEVLCDPSAHWGNLTRVLRLYNLPTLRAWGAMPRAMLPDEADPRMLGRVAKVSAFAKAQGERELAAAVAKSRMEAIGRQNALDLIDDRRYRY